MRSCVVCCTMKQCLILLPALLSLALWLYIFFTGPWEGIVFSFVFLAVSVIAYVVFSRGHRA